MEPVNKIPITDQILAVTYEVQQNNHQSKREELIKLINELISSDFSSLIQLLYRIDVSETTLKQNLKQSDGVDSASIIADMIIERQLQKSNFTKKSTEDQGVDDEERW